MHFAAPYRHFRFSTMLGALTLLLFSLASAAQAPMNATAPASKHMVIIGASYAEEWQSPKLPGYTVTNKGVGGQESSDMRARFERDVIALKPDTVMIWGHYNDVVRAKPETMAAARKKAQDNYRAMVEQARAAGITPILVTEITIPVPDTIKEKLLGLVASVLGKSDYRTQKNIEIKALNAWLRDYAKAQNIQLLDLESALDSGNGTRKVEYARSDNSHISPAGYEAITRYVASQLG
jgi:lysophospholipase L1-like esterase